MKKVDLEAVNPQGRLDVLAYKAAERLARYIEEKQGLSGIWDNVKPHVHDLVTQNISGVKLPPELKALMGIIQANGDKLIQRNEGVK